MTAHFAPNKWGLTFHHLGLAVKDVDAAIRFLTGLGYRPGPKVFDPLQNVHLGMFTHDAMPDVEIIYPGDGAGPLDALLATHKDGLIYHTCYTSPDLDASLEAIEADGNLRLYEMSPPKPAVLFGGKPVAFYVVGGVGLIEIIDESRAGA
jgi:catechol 2,3-dioxygenase-like lactoylglutathione lyase family enzyme